MATVDDRVVAMSFENSKFESGVKSTIKALDALKNSLKFPEAGKGLDQITASANRTDLSHISRGIDSLNGKFGALRLTAIATLASITTQAVRAGAQFTKQFTFQPVIDGLHEYENQLNSVQTILSNTKSAGTNLSDVNGALNQLNKYADKTIYNFGQMTKNIGTFTAAGVDLKTSVGSIKGIANLAALSGSNAEQASTAMYQLSQAISSGRVSLQDWNSVVNAGMGGTVFQRALAQTAEKMGTLSSGAVSLKGKMKNVSIEGQSFRESIQAGPGKKSWLTSDVLTKTLKQFSGDLTDAELAAQGFNREEVKAIQSQAKMALDAATKVKTLSQLIDTSKEALGSGWAQTWQLIFGNFGEAKTLFTGLSNAIGGFIKKSAKARNQVLKDWKAAGGRTQLILGLKHAFEALAAVVEPIKEAFRDIFPRKTGGQLVSMTRSFLRFTQTLKPSQETLINLRKTFRGFFALFGIGKLIITGIASVFGKMFGALTQSSGGFLSLTAAIGDWISSLYLVLKTGNKVTKFFDNVGNVIAAPIAFFKELADAIAGAFSGEAFGKIGSTLSPIQNIINGVVDAWDKFLGTVGQTREIVKPALEGISEMFGQFGQVVADALKNADFDAVLKVLEVSFLGGIFLVLRKTLKGGLGNALAGGVLQSVVQAFTGVGGLTKSIGGTFNALTGSIQTMQQNIKSDTLKNIAISIALLSASIIGLSLVDPKRLNSALSAITIGFAQLLGAMAIMDKIGNSGGFIKMPVISASMILLAGAIDILAIAVAALSRLSWEELAKGLGAVSVLLGGISASSSILSKNSAGLIRASVGITVIAVALNLLAFAVKQFGNMDLDVLAKGIGAITTVLGGIGAAMQLFPPNMLLTSAGLVAISVALQLISISIEKLGNLDMATLGKGIGAIALALAGIGAAMQLMPGPAMVITAAGLVLVALALQGIAKTVETFGGMSITEIAKGIGTLAGALVVLAGGLYLMQGTLGGAAALAVASAGLALLAPALKTLGDQSWTEIIKGLTALAVAFGLLGIAGVVLAPVAPAILALGVALIAIGAGLALAGAGIALIGIGLSSIAIAGPAAVKILVDALVKLAEALPKVVQGLVKAVIGLVQGLADAAPKFLEATVKIIDMVLNAIVKESPKIANAIISLLDLVFKVINDRFPQLVETGIQMILSLLSGIGGHIGEVVKMVGTIITNFLNAVANNLGRIISAGANILIKFVEGIANNLARIVLAGGSIITKFIGAIAENLSRVASAGLSIITKLVTVISNNLSQVISLGTKIIVKLVKGIGDAATKISKAALNAASEFIGSMAREIPKQVNKVAGSVIDMLKALAPIIRKRESEFIGAMFDIGQAIIQGLIDGIVDKAKDIPGVIKDKVTHVIPKFIRKKLGVKSPSTVMIKIGRHIMDGLSLGLNRSGAGVETAAVRTGNRLLQAVQDTISSIPNDLGDVLNLDPVISPVLDLSAVHQEAKKMPEISSTVGVSADASLSQATAILAEKAAADQVQAEQASVTETPSVTFEQKNYSPEALSNIEIYRQTKNGLSQVKSLIGAPA